MNRRDWILKKMHTKECWSPKKGYVSLSEECFDIQPCLYKNRVVIAFDRQNTSWASETRWDGIMIDIDFCRITLIPGEVCGTRGDGIIIHADRELLNDLVSQHECRFHYAYMKNGSIIAFEVKPFFVAPIISGRRRMYINRMSTQEWSH